ncbi:MAG: tetraacyldisaccharide 4'-kinase [Magnetococcales bacterium]|nr:tetraacyldisaccharide 4'-kinase [Magnetococcales bacterium]
MSLRETILPRLDGSREWPRGPAGWLWQMLRGLAAPYGGTMRLRAEAYRRGLLSAWQAPCPVVSVGNLTTGGTGKTPLTLWMASHLQEVGYRVAVVSRGYGQTSREAVTLVADGEQVLERPPRAADEAVLLARRLPGVVVATGPERRAVIEALWRRFAPDVVILDDAFQHLRVRRDLDVVLLDGRRPFGNGRLLPAGLLREPPTALSRASLVCLTRLAEGVEVTSWKEKLLQLGYAGEVVATAHRPAGWQPLQGGACWPLEALRGRRVMGFAGLADPTSFRESLPALGLDVAGFQAFADHHFWGDAELRQLRERAHSLGAAYLVCTEKDLVKLPADGWEIPVVALRIDVVFTSEARPLIDALRRTVG